MDATLTTLQQILIHNYQLAPEVLTRTALLVDLGIDSLGTAELLFDVEDAFHVVLPPEPVTLSTLGDVVDFIDQLVSAQGAASSGAPEQLP